MSEQKVSLWDKWKVQFAFVAGALVVSSVWGTCSYSPTVAVTDEKAEETLPVGSTEVAPVTKEVSVTTTSETVTGGPTATDATTTTIVGATSAATTTDTTVAPVTTTVTPTTTK
jgi:hypothetical protein